MIIKKILKTIVIVTVFAVFAIKSCAQVSAGGAIVAVDERNLGGGGQVKTDSPATTASAQIKRTTKKSSGSKSNSKSVSKKPTNQTPQIITTRTVTTTSKKTTPKSPTSKKYDGFIIGDKYTLYNFEIVRYVQPIHTIAAQEAGAKGLVQVEILIGENGDVLQARARSGNKLLHPEAEKAALMTRFNKPSVYGKPARAIGFIVFRFGGEEN